MAGGITMGVVPFLVEEAMETDPLQPGDLVQLLATAEPPPGQVAPPRRWGYVVTPADDQGRVAIRVEGWHYPLLVPVQQLRRRAR